MNREDILIIVKKYIADAIDDVDCDTLDPSQSMKDIGINSLDIVEIVSRSMRELKVKVPRSELSKLGNINELVDVLAQAVENKNNNA